MQKYPICNTKMEF
uniref:Uncharacterized protein n=1 Tax=Anguilla anguilla TaxID=7936 RepID=A0A0E9UJW8_ANGAN